MNESLDKAITTLDKIGGRSERVSRLQKRLKRCVCKSCGGSLILKKMTYGKIEEGRIEIFCPKCNRIEYGVEEDVYRVAKYFVNVMEWDYFSDVENGEKKERMNVRKASEIINWSLEALGMIGDEGFRYPVKIGRELLGEELLLNEDLV